MRSVLMPVRRRLCESKAGKILAGAGITEPPVDVEAIAGSLFLTVVRADMAEHRGRSLLERGAIVVNANESEAGQRFSIGHEIGHAELHPDGFVFSAHEDPASAMYAADPDQELEREADYFSSVLLAPPRWLGKDVDAGLAPPALANRYQVSQAVIFIALRQHHLLSRVGRRRR